MTILNFPDAEPEPLDEELAACLDAVPVPKAEPETQPDQHQKSTYRYAAAP